MDLYTMLAEAAPARHAYLDGPGSPAAAGLYQRIIAAPPAAPRAARRTRLPAVAALTAAVAGLAVAATLVLIPGAPHTSRGAQAQLAAWTVTKRPDGLVNVTIRELRDPVGLWRMLRAAGVPANVRFLPHDFTPTTSATAIPRGCRAPHLSDRANAHLQAKIMPPPALPGDAHKIAPHVWVGIGRDTQPNVVLTIRPSAIPPGIGLSVAAWAAAPGTRSGDTLSVQTGLVQVSPQCTGS